MANQVKLTFAGDASQLERTFTAVGSDATKMASKVDTAGSTVKGGFDRMGDGADVGEQRIVGLRDAITGTGDVMTGLKEGNIALLLTGFADLASSVANFAGPVLSKLAGSLAATKVGTIATTIATNAWTVAQGALNLVLSLNPIGLVVIALAALVAGFILAWKHSETFRNVVRGALDAVGDAVGWVLDRFRGLWEFIRDLPGRVASALKRLPGIIAGAIPGGGIFGSIIDKLPGFAMGGVVPGAVGAPQLAVVHGGETITPAGRGGMGGVTIIVQGNVLDGRALGQLVSDAQRQNSRRGFT